jgi:hypothetical protein
MPRAKASVRTVPSWGERKAAGGVSGGVKPVRPVLKPVRPIWSLQGANLVFVPVRSLGLVQVVVVPVVGLESLQVVSLLGILSLVLNTGMGGVVALRWRGGTMHGFPLVVLVLLQVERVGSLIVVTVVVFVEVALVGEMFWIVLTPLLSKWLSTGFTLLVLTAVLSRLFAHMLVFEFLVGDLKNIWLIDSGCSRHMTGEKGWFSSLVLVVTKRYISFGDNGRGRVLSKGEIKVSDKITLRRLLLFNRLGTICFLCPSYWMRVLRCCFGLVVLRFWTLEGTLSVWSFPRVRCFELIFLSLLLLSVVSWLVLRVSCGSGIGSWVT